MVFTDEHVCPTLNRHPPGAGETYDTLDNVDLGGNNCIEALFELISPPLEGAVGVVVMGDSGLSGPYDGYWGAGIPLPTGEYLQMRIYPRNSIGKSIGEDETRFLAIRRTSHGTTPCVGYGVLYLPRRLSAFESNAPLVTGSTIGCRGVHMVLPSLFSKHNPHRDKTIRHAQLDVEGFHSIRPSALCLTTSHGLLKNPNTSYVFTPGDAYTVIAGHMAGTDVPDPLQLSASTMTDSNYYRHIATRQRRLVQSMGAAKAGTYVASAVTLCEFLSAEGILGVMSNSFFSGALPDMMSSPLGTPLIITMAVHIACYPERFNLPPCTKQDTFANRDMIRAFSSRWDKVMRNKFRAIDVVVKAGYDNAATQTTAEKGVAMQLDDNLRFWQRVGQRVISKLASNPSEEMCGGNKAAFQTRFGVAELLMDRVSDCKYDSLSKQNDCLPIKETPIDRIFTAPRADVKTTLYRIQDSAETWLRTGEFGKHCISRPNTNVATAGQHPNDTRLCQTGDTCLKCNPLCRAMAGAEKAEAANVDLSSSSSESDDDDHIMDNKICMNAMESAAEVIATSMLNGPSVVLHGPYATHQMGIKCYLVGSGCSNTCADCDNRVGVLEGTLFSTKASECSHCNRKRCFSCTSKSLRSENAPDKHCLRCAPGAPSEYKPLSPPGLARKKQTTKKQSAKKQSTKGW